MVAATWWTPISCRRATSASATLGLALAADDHDLVADLRVRDGERSICVCSSDGAATTGGRKVAHHNAVGVQPPEAVGEAHGDDAEPHGETHGERRHLGEALTRVMSLRAMTRVDSARNVERSGVGAISSGKVRP